MKLWGARFQKETDGLVNDFNSSLSFDQRMYREDIEGSLAHAKMLAECGIISQEDGKAIERGLEEVLCEIEDGIVQLDPENEDIHMNVEVLLTEKIGQAGKKLHTARSRNDQVAVDLRLYLKKVVKEVVGELVKLENALIRLSQDNQDTVMPGYTHLQRAQPVSFAHHLLAYAQMFKRDITRLEDTYVRMDESPLGSGALSGTTYPIDRYQTALDLGFSSPCSNSMDGVSDRDYVIELLSDYSILMMHLSRFSEEIILWCSWEFQFIELDDAYSTGSSIMPQKKNPDVAELVRGKTGRVYGSLMTLLTVMKALPLAYNKDMQEDKEAIFDASDTVLMCLPVFTGMIATMKVRKENMKKAAAKGFINATDLADYLVRKGMAFRDAYKVVGSLVYFAQQRGAGLEELSLDEMKAFSPLIDEDVYDSLDLEACMNRRRSHGGPSVEETGRQIEEIRCFLEEMEKWQNQ